MVVHNYRNVKFSVSLVSNNRPMRYFCAKISLVNSKINATRNSPKIDKTML